MQACRAVVLQCGMACRPGGGGSGARGSSASSSWPAVVRSARSKNPVDRGACQCAFPESAQTKKE
eukprot:1404889-Prorocentrum_lima.AAC.1